MQGASSWRGLGSVLPVATAGCADAKPLQKCVCVCMDVCTHKCCVPLWLIVLISYCSAGGSRAEAESTSLYRGTPSRDVGWRSGTEASRHLPTDTLIVSWSVKLWFYCNIIALGYDANFMGYIIIFLILQYTCRRRPDTQSKPYIIMLCSKLESGQT